MEGKNVMKFFCDVKNTEQIVFYSFTKWNYTFLEEKENILTQLEMLSIVASTRKISFLILVSINSRGSQKNLPFPLKGLKGLSVKRSELTLSNNSRDG